MQLRRSRTRSTATKRHSLLWTTRRRLPGRTYLGALASRGPRISARFLWCAGCLELPLPPPISEIAASSQNRKREREQNHTGARSASAGRGRRSDSSIWTSCSSTVLWSTRPPDLPDGRPLWKPGRWARSIRSVPRTSECFLPAPPV